MLDDNDASMMSAIEKTTEISIADFKKWLQGKQKFEKKQTREQLHREYLEDKRRQKVAEQKQNVADGGIISLKKGGKADKKWIQKATKGMRKDKPCTGKKFGSATCPPGSKRYNLAKTFKKMARSKHASGGLVRFI